MHSQALHFLNTLTVIALSATSITAMGPMPSSSVPGECQTVCDPIVKLMATCDMKPMRRDSANDPSLSRRESPSDQGMKMDSDCICKNTSFDVKSMTGMCASCMGQNQKTADKMAMEGMASEGFLDTFMLAQGV
ncbi:hypothetical protein CC80DRAFT_493806 [Byssothecium circinans]|uniref:Uncharacterized protein n=1 Tax=Byssothecium circinans TaxID=147558 RepID=A0A6A5TNR4_9PLEO|nr:hypothetical protein CC80DRAFT_493806 [Byssothecium circinans]